MGSTRDLHPPSTSLRCPTFFPDVYFGPTPPVATVDPGRDEDGQLERSGVRVEPDPGPNQEREETPNGRWS